MKVFKSLKWLWVTISLISRTSLLLIGAVIVIVLLLGKNEQEKFKEINKYDYQARAYELKSNVKGALLLAPGNIYNRGTSAGVNNALLEKYGYRASRSIYTTKDYIEAINLASIDDQVTGLVISLKNFNPASLGIALEFANAIKKFKAQSGKPVVAVSSESIDKDSLLIASIADYFYHGVGTHIAYSKPYASIAYLGDFFNKYGLQSMSVRSGSYDATIDGDLGNTMSPNVKTNALVLTEGVWNSYLKQLSFYKEKVYTADDVSDNAIIERLAQDINFNQQNLNLGLVTAYLTDFELDDELIKIFGKKDQTFNQISFTQYLSKVNKFNTPNYKEKHIAIFNVNGLLSSTNSNQSKISVNGKYIAEKLNSITNAQEKDRVVSGIIFKVNSAGGQISDAEWLRDAINKTRNAGIPVYVYVEDYLTNAAYLAFSGATKIYANNLSVIGGISVSWLGSINASKFYQEFQDINISPTPGNTKFREHLSKFPYPVPLVENRYISTTSFQPEFLQYRQSIVDAQHTNFRLEVKNARPKVNLDNVGDGQLFMATDAIKQNLIDKVASFHQTLVDLRKDIASSQKDGLAYSMDAYNYDTIRASGSNLDNLLNKYFTEYSDFDLDEIAAKHNLTVQQLSYELQGMNETAIQEPYSVCIFCLTK